MRAPKSLYLPSETVEETYRRDTDGASKHGQHAGATMEGIEACTRLILFGVSLSSFDVELGRYISAGFQNTRGPRKVEIIDRRPKPVAERLQFYAPSLDPAVISLRRVRCRA
jgi:hypothetical protein